MDVFKVEYYEFWDEEKEGNFNSKTVAAEDAEEAISKARKIAIQNTECPYAEKPSKKHKLSIEIFQVLHETELDG